MKANIFYKDKYFKYKMKYNNLKKMNGGYNYSNFGIINLDPLNRAEILENPLLNLKKEIKLTYLICEFLSLLKKNKLSEQISDDAFEITKLTKLNELSEQIKNELFLITKLNDIKCMDVYEFIEKILPNINDKINYKKQHDLFYSTYKKNTYGLDEITPDGEFVNTPCAGRVNCMFLQCLDKSLEADSYIVYYIDKNYKMIMVVNNSNFIQINNSSISEHIFIHKFPSTELTERIYGKKNFDMAIKLHKYAVQQLKPNFVVSSPIPIMIPIFKKLCEENIFVEVDKTNFIPFFRYGKKNKVNVISDTSYLESMGPDVFCFEPDHIYWVMKNINLID